MEPEGSLPCLQETATGLIKFQIQICCWLTVAVFCYFGVVFKVAEPCCNEYHLTQWNKADIVHKEENRVKRKKSVFIRTIEEAISHPNV